MDNTVFIVNGYHPRDEGMFSEHEKKLIIDYLRRGHVIAYAPAICNDEFTGERIDGPLAFLSDGRFGWTSEIIYYFEKYNIELNSEFVKVALAA